MVRVDLWMYTEFVDASHTPLEHYQSNTPAEALSCFYVIGTCNCIGYISLQSIVWKEQVASLTCDVSN
jgi:hypothetical protein